MNTVIDKNAPNVGAVENISSENNRSVWGMQAPGIVQSHPVRDQVSDEEWNERVNLAACYRLMDKYGMTEMIYNHITARVPGAADQLLINAYGLHYSEITASSLHKINHEGEFVLRGNTHYGMNYPGFVIHGAVHMGRPDVNCVIHTHSTAGIAVSAMKTGLLPLCLLSMRFYGHIGYHECEGTVVDISERESLVKDLGPHDAMFLRHHGVIACGASIAEAFNTHYMLERACKVQVDTMAAGKEILLPSTKAVEDTAYQFRPDTRRRYGMLEWDAMIRMMDRDDPSFRN